ncbi:hypothetical protein ACS0TY_001247 [Phlomoides rotata]
MGCYRLSERRKLLFRWCYSVKLSEESIIHSMYINVHEFAVMYLLPVLLVVDTALALD